MLTLSSNLIRWMKLLHRILYPKSQVSEFKSQISNSNLKSQISNLKSPDASQLALRNWLSSGLFLLPHFHLNHRLKNILKWH